MTQNKDSEALKWVNKRIYLIETGLPMRDQWSDSLNTEYESLKTIRKALSRPSTKPCCRCQQNGVDVNETDFVDIPESVDNEQNTSVDVCEHKDGCDAHNLQDICPCADGVDVEKSETAEWLMNLWTTYAERGGTPLEELEILEAAYNEINELSSRTPIGKQIDWDGEKRHDNPYHDVKECELYEAQEDHNTAWNDAIDHIKEMVEGNHE